MAKIIQNSKKTEYIDLHSSFFNLLSWKAMHREERDGKIYSYQRSLKNMLSRNKFTKKQLNELWEEDRTITTSQPLDGILRQYQEQSKILMQLLNEGISIDFLKIN